MANYFAKPNLVDSYLFLHAAYLCFSPLAVRSPALAEYGAGPQSYAIVLGRLICVGTEASIFDCPMSNNPTSNCFHGGDVGVECEGAVIDPFVQQLLFIIL